MTLDYNTGATPSNLVKIYSPLVLCKFVLDCYDLSHCATTAHFCLKLIAKVVRIWLLSLIYFSGHFREIGIAVTVSG